MPVFSLGKQDQISLLWSGGGRSMPTSSACPRRLTWSYSPHGGLSPDIKIKLEWKCLQIQITLSGGVYIWFVIYKENILFYLFFLVVYETVFARREDWQGLERSELLKYFNDCGHFPMHQQIDEVWDLVHRGIFSFLFFAFSFLFFLRVFLLCSFLPSLTFIKLVL